MLAPSSPTNGGRSVGIVRSRTKVTEFSFATFLEDVMLLSMYLFLGVGLVELLGD
jgi:hypothetical protein